MRSTTCKLTVISALTVLGMSVAEATVITDRDPGGSEVMLSFVNLAGDSITQDLGVQMAGFEAGDYTLSPLVLDFINSNGASTVQFGIIAGDSPLNRVYLTTSPRPNFLEDQQVANSAKSLWSSSLDLMIKGFNFEDPDQSTDFNKAYGPFLSGTGSPNYIDGLHDNWQSGDWGLSNLSELGALADPLKIYTIKFYAQNLGLNNFVPFKGGLAATVDVAGGKLSVQNSVVPVPAAVWLFGSALGLLGCASRRGRTG